MIYFKPRMIVLETAFVSINILISL